MNQKPYFSTIDVSLVSVFCALWVVLNLTLGPLSFQLLGLSVLHDVAAFFTLLLTTWATGKLGTASLVGTIGSIAAILIGAPLVVAGFAAASVLFDVLMSLSHHRLDATSIAVLTTLFATTVSAYSAGILIGILFTTNPLIWALTFWGPWHLVGGIISLAITLPVLSLLGKIKVRRIESNQ